MSKLTLFILIPYTTPLRTLGALDPITASVIRKDKVRADDMAVPSLLFRPGSGAMVSQPSSHARAATLTVGRLQEPLLVNAGTPGLAATSSTD